MVTYIRNYQKLQSGLFTNILSIREAELRRTREGLSMVGMR